MAVREGKARLAAYRAQTVELSYGDMTYVDLGEGEVILSVHVIFGTGIRVSELQYITVEAVKLGEATVSCKAKTR